MANFIEQLIAEWYEYQGYFVRRNVKVGKRSEGGYECELDVVAFGPIKQHLIHFEPSMDSDSWARREERYAKKFKAGRKHIPALFKGLNLPTNIEQVAVLGYASKTNRQTLAGGKILLMPELLKNIYDLLGNKRVEKAAVPEQFPILRGMQFTAHYRKEIFE